MAKYYVAIYVKYPDGGEGRYDATVYADDEDDAVDEAMAKLPKGTKLVDVIKVEQPG